MRRFEFSQLADYRQQVYDIYARVRDPGLAPQERWQRFRVDQDRLFKSHPQTALTPNQVGKFSSLPFFPYDPEFRFQLPIESSG